MFSTTGANHIVAKTCLKPDSPCSFLQPRLFLLLVSLPKARWRSISCVIKYLYEGRSGGSLCGFIRMWDFQVEKRDLNKSGMPSPVLRSCWLFYSTPKPSLPGCHSANRRGQPYRLQVLYACGWAPLVGGAKVSRGSVVWVGCGSVRTGVELPCPGPKEAGESLLRENSPGSWPGGNVSFCPLLLSPLIMALPVSACFFPQPPSLTGEARVTETQGKKVG